jgi:hypothetical protein
MKKLSLLVIIIGAGWFFRHPLVGVFLDSSREKELASDFIQYCVATIPDVQKIKLTATSNGWRTLSEQELKEGNFSAENAAEGWETPGGFSLVTMTDEKKQPACSLSAESAFGYSVISSIQKLLPNLSQPTVISHKQADSGIKNKIQEDGASTPSGSYGDMYLWDVNKGGKMLRIGMITYNKSRVSLVDSNVTLFVAEVNYQ